jgi:hypothetical protein
LAPKCVSHQQPLDKKMSKLRKSQKTNYIRCLVIVFKVELTDEGSQKNSMWHIFDFLCLWKAWKDNICNH